MIEDKPISTNVIVEASFTYQTILIMLFALCLAVLLQITILSRTNRIETSLINMRNACMIVPSTSSGTEKEKP